MPSSIVTMTTRKPSDARHRCRTRCHAPRSTEPAREARPASPLVAARSVISGGAGLVADAAHGHDDLGALGVVLDLGAQPLDVDVDEAGVTGVAVAPDLLEQHLAGEDLPRLARQGDEQVELERRQRRADSPSRFTEWPATSMSRSPIDSFSGAGSSPRRSRARTRAMSSCGLKGLTT